MTPFPAPLSLSDAVTWAEQQHHTSLRSNGPGVIMHVVRDDQGTIWVITGGERERFAALSMQQPLPIIQSVPTQASP